MKKTVLVILIILAVSLAGIALSSAWAEGNDHYYQIVSFPSISLKTDQGKRIDSIKIVTCFGRFATINLIAKDWSAKVVSPVSEETMLSMTAGDGNPVVWHSEDLSGLLQCLSVNPPVLISRRHYRFPIMTDGKYMNERFS